MDSFRLPSMRHSRSMLLPRLFMTPALVPLTRRLVIQGRHVHSVGSKLVSSQQAVCYFHARWCCKWVFHGSFVCEPFQLSDGATNGPLSED